MIGRTHGQPALPTTLGLKIAGWLDETIRNFDRLLVCKKNILVSQLFGGVGTMSALSDQAEDLLDLFSSRLGLTPLSEQEIKLLPRLWGSCISVIFKSGMIPLIEELSTEPFI